MNATIAARRFPPAANRRAVTVSPEQMVRFTTLSAEGKLPLVIEPSLSGVDVYTWAIANRNLLDARLVEHGAILFRGFPLASAADFERFVRATGTEPLPYEERSSPRHEVGHGVYTSTDYPASQSIFPHHEHSYKRTFPLHIYFLCETPAETGGATPIADGRKVRARLKPSTIEKFIDKGWMYVRNFGEHIGLPWQQAFQTEDRSAVEQYCQRQKIEFEWRADGQLRTRQVRPAFAHHPRTGEVLWFNHATFFHLTTLPSEIRDVIGGAYHSADLPNNTYYGDGSEIEAQVLEELRDAYLKESVVFPWRQGDVLMVDNMLTAHARSPYIGERRILVAMATAVTRDDL